MIISPLYMYKIRSKKGDFGGENPFIEPFVTIFSMSTSSRFLALFAQHRSTHPIQTLMVKPFVISFIFAFIAKTIKKGGIICQRLQRSQCK